MADNNNSEKITLICSDGERFEVDEKIAIRSETIKHLIEDGCAENGIPIANVTGKVMSKVLEYCTKHAEHEVAGSKAVDTELALAPGSGVGVGGDSEIKDWDAKFVDVGFPGELFQLVSAANYLHIQELLDLTTKAVADKIKDKQPEEVRKIFNIVNDFTPEEEEQLRKENSWAYEVEDQKSSTKSS